MSQLERANDFEASLKAVIRSELLLLQTSCPVQVVSYDPLSMTATVQPLIRARVPLPDGTHIMVKPQLLVTVPVIFQSGGGFTLTFPIKPNDEGVCIFSSRAIDLWWLQGGIQNPVEFRIHSADDGFLMVGARSKPNVLPNISTTEVQLRSDDGLTSIGMGPLGAINIVAPLPGLVTITGNLLVTGTITGVVVAP